MITPQNVLRHELIGLYARVASAPNPSHEGRAGIITDESRNMLVLATPCGIKKIPKRYALFDLCLPDDTRVRVDGSVLVMQPEKRISMRIRNQR
ncbi:MAG: ribonuclease P protein component 1 [Methanomicrobiales archaeon]|nr:ribonuclease P protein component 1 [Methanomicrobiales archaeon]